MCLCYGQLLILVRGAGSELKAGEAGWGDNEETWMSLSSGNVDFAETDAQIEMELFGSLRRCPTVRSLGSWAGIIPIALSITVISF